MFIASSSVVRMAVKCCFNMAFTIEHNWR